MTSRKRRMGLGDAMRLEGLEARLVLSGPGGGAVQVAGASAAIATATFRVTQDWGAGFGGEIVVKNLTGQPIAPWTLEFDFDRKIDSIWDATIAAKSGNLYVIKTAGWNNAIPAGGTVRFGFNGSPGNVTSAPTGYRLNGQALDGSTPNPGTPGLSASDASVAEGNVGQASMVFAVTLSSASTRTVTVNYATADGTAKAGTDYLTRSGMLTFAPGVTTQNVTVPVIGNTLVEANETFTLNLSGPTGGAILADRVGLGTIQNDDAFPQPSGVPAKPSLSVQDVPGDSTRYKATFNIWWGNNATSWQLLENGRVIHTAALVARSPNAQTASFTVTGRTYGAYEYQAKAINAAGETVSDKVVRVVGGASRIVVGSVDGARQALQVTMGQGVQEFDLKELGAASAQFQVITNNVGVVKPQMVTPTRLRLTGLASGLASVKIRDAATGEERYLGVRVRKADGTLPGMPDSVAIGSVSEDTPAHLSFWRDFDTDDTNRRMDVRYIYLNGGPYNGWRTWSDTDGGRATSYLRESQKLGMVPYFVYYNIPDGGESYFTNLQHIQSKQYMTDYFKDLKRTLDIIKQEASDQTVGMILEPDFLGYLMQNSGKQPGQIAAFASAAYDAGVLSRTADPLFADTVTGLVRAINYTISKHAPNVRFGWQMNLWASPGITTSIPGNGLMHLTDTLGIAAGRAKIASEARAIAQYYVNAGVLSYGAKFVSFDKYGLDATAENGAAANPAGSTWFWNADHWNNYLMFAKSVRETTGVPITLWQLPVGHIDGSLAANPYNGGLFPDLNETNQRYEDSAPSFFFGDTFRTSGSRTAYFGTNRGADPLVSVSGSTVTWGSHIAAARNAGIDTILFGAGVGDSTQGVGSPPTDGYWWITKAQRYYASPVRLR